jgi:phosphoribosylformylglycinamidine (FGAM) synthase PurS component
MVVSEVKTIAIQLLANPIVASFGYEKVIDLNF